MVCDIHPHMKQSSLFHSQTPNPLPGAIPSYFTPVSHIFIIPCWVDPISCGMTDSKKRILKSEKPRKSRQFVPTVNSKNECGIQSL